MRRWIHNDTETRLVPDADAGYEVEIDLIERRAKSPADAQRQLEDRARLTGLLAVHNRFDYLNSILHGFRQAEDPIYRAAAALWIAVENALVTGAQTQPKTTPKTGPVLAEQLLTNKLLTDKS